MNLRTRVKICGITRTEDAVEAARLGVDAIGLVFYENSPRHLSIAQAQQVCQALPGFVTVVSLFLNPEAGLVKDVLASVPVDLLQFHGNESGDFCRSFNRPYIKALGMADDQDLEQRANEYPDARGVLLDSHASGAAGGTGEAFDWASIPQPFRQSIILAGGLSPQNIAEAIKTVRPYAVDLSSGVEAAPGIKDASLMAQLMKEVKRVDCENS
ncbi:MAG: phosphoribosylanthranilate isomerase [Gammaproteobacteria bacterium]